MSTIAPNPTERPREIVIVAREAPRLHAHLMRIFAGMPEVEVILDRRVGERRRRRSTPPEERRRAERRRGAEADSHLEALGWAIVRLC